VRIFESEGRRLVEGDFRIRFFVDGLFYIELQSEMNIDFRH
jgi:hypothetical protein